MLEERRRFLKTTLGAGLFGAGVILTAQYGIASASEVQESNGVVVGLSPKKEILYRKTGEWEAYYKAAY
ncbi:MAG: Tat pathway signal protein [Desulfocapsaceae bacterium]|nr:Tat pathway signal protein [Desulfocapsaceae bacterium]